MERGIMIADQQSGTLVATRRAVQNTFDDDPRDVSIVNVAAPIVDTWVRNLLYFTPNPDGSVDARTFFGEIQRGDHAKIVVHLGGVPLGVGHSVDIVCLSVGRVDELSLMGGEVLDLARIGIIGKQTVTDTGAYIDATDAAYHEPVVFDLLGAELIDVIIHPKGYLSSDPEFHLTATYGFI